MLPLFLLVIFGYAANFTVTGRTPATALVDGSNLFAAQSTVAVLNRAGDNITTDISFNPDLTTSWVMVPAIIGLILTVIGTIITSIGLVREQEAQECDRLLLMSHGELVGHGSEADIIGDTTAAVVHTDDWAAAFTALNAAGAAVILDGRTVRVADSTSAEVERILDAAGTDGTVRPARATIEERMLNLARD